jgi:hypothetical protein
MACWDMACWDMACWGTVGGVRRRADLVVAAVLAAAGVGPAERVRAAAAGERADGRLPHDRRDGAGGRRGRAQVATLWRRSVDVPAARYAGWVAAVALLPALVLLATLLDRGSVALPPAPVPLVAVPLLAVVYWRRRWPRRSAGPPP